MFWWFPIMKALVRSFSVYSVVIIILCFIAIMVFFRNDALASSIAFLQTDLTVSNRSSEGHSEFSLLKAQEVIRIFRWHTPTNDIKWLYVPFITLKRLPKLMFRSRYTICFIYQTCNFYFVKILFKLREFPCQIIILQITCLMTFLN